MKKLISPKRLKWIALILAAVLVLTTVVGFLNSMGYNLVTYIDYGIWAGYVEFKENKEDFELLKAHLCLFVDSRPDFFEEFDGDFYFTKDGINFSKNEKGLYFHPVEAEGWADARNNYYDAFPEWAKGPGERQTHIYPNYIVFYSTLVYTRDGKYPKERVNQWKDLGIKTRLVVRHAKGWYEVRR